MGTGLILGPMLIATYNYLFFINTIDKSNNNKSIDMLNRNKIISPYWITGFADGESSFSIRITKDITEKQC